LPTNDYTLILLQTNRQSFAYLLHPPMSKRLLVCETNRQSFADIDTYTQSNS